MLQMTERNTVQAIRAFCPRKLQQEAARLGQHFLFADLKHARSRIEVFKIVARDFGIPLMHVKDHARLYHCMTQVMKQSGEQTGFLIVLHNLPQVMRFGVEAREIFLDVFRDIADFWASHNVPFRVFYSHYVTKVEVVNILTPSLLLV